MHRTIGEQYTGTAGELAAGSGHSYREEVSEMLRNLIVLLALVVGMICIAMVLRADGGRRTVALHAPTVVTALLSGTAAGR
jgi:hypothetical protein